MFFFSEYRTKRNSTVFYFTISWFDSLDMLALGRFTTLFNCIVVVWCCALRGSRVCAFGFDLVALMCLMFETGLLCYGFAQRYDLFQNARLFIFGWRRKSSECYSFWFHSMRSRTILECQTLRLLRRIVHVIRKISSLWLSLMIFRP